MDADAIRLLLTPDGMRALSRAEAFGATSAGSISAAVTALRRDGYAPDVTAAALTEARLRQRARAKFGDFAASMLFTDDGLQQATRLAVAALHAGRFRTAGVHRVADLGCGVGGDALALAGIGLEVSAIDADEATAACAAYNLAPFPTATVEHGLAQDADLEAVDAAYCDPARRSGADGDSRRLRDPSQFSPSLDWVYSLADRLPLGIKLGPGHPHDDIPPDCEALWVSDRGAAVELGLWFGSLAREGHRYGALVLSPDGAAEIAGDEHPEPVPIRTLGGVLYDPDPAVIRARALPRLAAALQAGAISPDIAYLTADDARPTPFASAFDVVAVLPLQPKRLRAEIHARGIGSLEIKKRGADIDPAALRRALAPRGDGEAVLFVTRVQGRHRAILAKRIPQERRNGRRAQAEMPPVVPTSK